MFLIGYAGGSSLNPRSLVSPAGAGGEHSVGREIRTLRKAKGLTLAALSERTGLSLGYLSQVERGASMPSVKAFNDIATALGVTIGWFFEGAATAPAEERDHIVRGDRRRVLRYEAGIVDSLLTPDLSGTLQLLHCIFPPHTNSGGTCYREDGEEAGLVLAGQFELWLGERRHLLREGDSFRFPSSVPHRYGNPGDTETVVIWVVTPPSF